ncbi:aspartyl protease family protein 1-like [Thalictrum thalictroides]|uniref:Aspartyl protease family protein 1-like n=1 Tax=Thalictrum thalictroides TaxID=46969 RepID=A0A7J6W2I3_THATH|nr:aspartyl protease family protein 1-like [Thalictrum thalictroides]
MKLASLLLLIIFFCSLTFHFQSTHGRTFTFEMHHGFSEPVKKWVHNHTHNWPVKGTVDYYYALANRDRLLLLRGRRRLSDNDGSITFSDGNSTLLISSLGFLHYAAVSLGTPSKKFLVALDTGSDLFWVPCDCSSCAPTNASTYGSDYELSIYDPKGSLTSKKITCDNTLCTQRTRCLGTFSNCPYAVSYISTDTSTSGVLVEDVLHLITEDSQPEVVDAWITFGWVVAYLFADSLLSQMGLTADSFSMCFGRDGFGRISFGDKGSSDQVETPFSVSLFHPTYNITVTQIRVGSSLIDTQFSALFDSGTSFTYMLDPVYTQLSESFNLHTQDSRLHFDTRLPFEYCYKMSSDANSSLIPSVSLSMNGGGQFLVYDPIIVISSQDEFYYCLAILKSTDLNIIGQNFMNGYKIVFDREKLVLGWKKFDCYNIEETNSMPVNLGNATGLPPGVAAGPGSCPPEVTKDPANNSEIDVRPATKVSSSPQRTYSCRVALPMHFLLNVVIPFSILLSML